MRIDSQLLKSVVNDVAVQAREAANELEQQGFSKSFVEHCTELIFDLNFSFEFNTAVARYMHELKEKQEIKIMTPFIVPAPLKN